ncbi:hypothetical protein ACJX0J_027624 [Zea mays]
MPVALNTKFLIYPMHQWVFLAGPDALDLFNINEDIFFLCPFILSILSFSLYICFLDISIMFFNSEKKISPDNLSNIWAGSVIICGTLTWPVTVLLLHHKKQ